VHDVLLGILAIVLWGAALAEGAEDPNAKAIEAAAPEQAPAKPARPRKILVYGRLPTHGDSVRFCFKAVEALGRKTGAFEVVSSGDPKLLLPDSLKQFDAIVMNNTHEQAFWLPIDFKNLTPEQQNEAKGREEAIKKGFLEFVAGGKGLVGIHGATCGVKWPEYNDMIGGTYAGHTGGSAWIKVEDPAHPLCAMLPKEGFEANDEFYVLGGPYSRQKVRVLTSLDLTKTADPQKLKVKDYPVSWIREQGKGRVFYCSLGHSLASFRSPHVLKHILAGIQYAIGDLPADATPAEKAN